MAVLEAWRQRVPVVATACPGNVDLIEDIQTGLLYDGDPANAAKALARILSDDTFANHLAEAAAQRCMKHYDRELMAQVLCRLYCAVCSATDR